MKTSYEMALERIAYLKTLDAISYEDADETLSFEDSYSRLEAMWHLYHKMQRADWLKLLGEHWAICENISALRTGLKYRMGTVGPINEMMENEEITAYDALPDCITVYRGCSKHNIVGASWSTDKSVAQKFPFLERYRAKVPLLVTGIVKKKNVLAIKLGRNENEIISFSVKRISVEPITGEFCGDKWITLPQAAGYLQP